MITAAIISAPRPTSYLNRTVASLKNAGVPLHGICRDHHRSGSFLNFRRALTDLVRQRDDCEAYVIFEDDVIVSRGLGAWLKSNVPAGVASLYCPSFYSRGETGWQETHLTPRTMGQCEASCALVISRESAEQFLREVAWKRPTGTGFAVGTWCLESRTPYFQHRPSLVSHIGEKSAIDGRQFSLRRREAEFCHDVTAL